MIEESKEFFLITINSKIPKCNTEKSNIKILCFEPITSDLYENNKKIEGETFFSNEYLSLYNSYKFRQNKYLYKSNLCFNLDANTLATELQNFNFYLISDSNPNHYTVDSNYQFIRPNESTKKLLNLNKQITKTLFCIGISIDFTIESNNFNDFLNLFRNMFLIDSLETDIILPSYLIIQNFENYLSMKLAIFLMAELDIPLFVSTKFESYQDNKIYILKDNIGKVFSEVKNYTHNKKKDIKEFYKKIVIELNSDFIGGTFTVNTNSSFAFSLSGTSNEKSFSFSNVKMDSIIIDFLADGFNFCFGYSDRDLYFVNKVEEILKNKNLQEEIESLKTNHCGILSSTKKNKLNFMVSNMAKYPNQIFIKPNISFLSEYISFGGPGYSYIFNDLKILEGDKTNNNGFIELLTWWKTPPKIKAKLNYIDCSFCLQTKEDTDEVIRKNDLIFCTFNCLSKYNKLKK